MADPFGGSWRSLFDGAGVHAEHAEHARWITAYRQNILMPDVTVADRFNPSECTGIFDESGQELTHERRVELAKQRQLEDPDDYRTAKYADLDKQDFTGETAVKLRRKHIVFVQDREMDVEDVQKRSQGVDKAIQLQNRLNGKDHD